MTAAEVHAALRDIYIDDCPDLNSELRCAIRILVAVTMNVLEAAGAAS